MRIFNIALVGISTLSAYVIVRTTLSIPLFAMCMITIFALSIIAVLRDEIALYITMAGSAISVGVAAGIFINDRFWYWEQLPVIGGIGIGFVALAVSASIWLRAPEIELNERYIIRGLGYFRTIDGEPYQRERAFTVPFVERCYAVVPLNVQNHRQSVGPMNTKPRMGARGLYNYTISQIRVDVGYEFNWIDANGLHAISNLLNKQHEAARRMNRSFSPVLYSDPAFAKELMSTHLEHELEVIIEDVIYASDWSPVEIEAHLDDVQSRIQGRLGRLAEDLDIIIHRVHLGNINSNEHEALAASFRHGLQAQDAALQASLLATAQAQGYGNRVREVGQAADELSQILPLHLVGAVVETTRTAPGHMQGGRTPADTTLDTVQLDRNELMSSRRNRGDTDRNRH
jgi:hypothetical protein